MNITERMKKAFAGTDGVRSTALDPEVIRRSDYELWLDENDGFLYQLSLFKKVDITDRAQVVNAIKSLEALLVKIIRWHEDYDSILEKDDFRNFISLYEKHLALLKKHEGVNFEKARCSFAMCLRIFQLMAGVLFDYPNVPLSFTGMPEEIRNVI